MSSASQLETAAILRKHGIRPRHRLGQNFLHDAGALQHIVSAAEIRSDEVVLEIGCGLGSLTRYLAQAAQKVVAVELDADLAALASESLAPFKNIKVICADFLEIALADLGLPTQYVVAANIPYYITSPILRRLLESTPKPGRIVLTVQKEVAERICASPPDMSLLAVSVQVFGTPRVVASIPASAFYPRPRVDSAVVRVDCYAQPAVPPALLPSFFRVAKAGFSQPRKMLSNALRGGLAVAADDARAYLQQANIDSRRRAETLTIADWVRLTEIVPGNN